MFSQAQKAFSALGEAELMGYELSLVLPFLSVCNTEISIHSAFRLSAVIFFLNYSKTWQEFCLGSDVSISLSITCLIFE